MAREISNSDDVIDSRDVIARIAELESIEARDDDENSELGTLQALASEGEGFADWTHGEILVRESYFEEYAQELAEDIGAIPTNMDWPCRCIDWEQAARELRMDYSSLDFDGVTYLARS